ncbi:MAG TPA: lipoyl synthase [Clostridia bacterium]|nr:lipoyl synthase [Clostridia bacterium]
MPNKNECSHNEEQKSMPRKFPPWMKKRLPALAGNVVATKQVLDKLGLNTVCQSALCPNLGECFARRTATFMILGDTCTRDCRFCAVSSGAPSSVDPGEALRVAQGAAQLGLKHVVITSVTRDDLPDGGAGHFAATIRAIRQHLPEVKIEVLTPDFNGNLNAIKTVIEAQPDIFNHNLETVPRLYPLARPQAEYIWSLCMLEKIKDLSSDIYTKSGIMVGLGEREEEVIKLMEDLRQVNCDILTIGQYLQPSQNHLEVVEYVHPEVFEKYRMAGEKMGFLHVASSPYVRSSFNAGEFSERYMA